MKWYNYLNPKTDGDKGKALLENETISEYNMIICQKLDYLYFGKFENYLDFYKYMIKEVPREKRCFYEIIPGNKSQKPYFDIEFNVKDNIDEPMTCFETGKLILPTHQADQSIATLVKIVEKHIPPLSQNKSHILVFTSHKNDKRSYHVVVEKYYFPDHKSNKIFHDKVVSEMPQCWKDIVDHSMYKSSQQFRISGSCKFGTDRFKILNRKLTLCYNGKNMWIPPVTPEDNLHEQLLLLEASLITQITSSTAMVSLVSPEEEMKISERKARLTASGFVFNPLTTDEIKEVLGLCYKRAGLEYGDARFPFTFKEIVEDNDESSILLLKRLRPSMCLSCNRIHEHENPYLIVAGQDRDIYLDCRRNEKHKKTYIGRLGIKPGTERIESETNVPIPEFDDRYASMFIEETATESNSILPFKNSVDVNTMRKQLEQLSETLLSEKKSKPTKTYKPKKEKVKALLDF